MSYQRNYWHDGDRITAEKMNHLEAGVEAQTSGYDAVICGNTFGSNTNLVLKSGDFQTVHNKVMNFKPVNILHYEEYDSGNGIVFSRTERVWCGSTGELFISVDGAEHSGIIVWDSEGNIFFD